MTLLSIADDLASASFADEHVARLLATLGDEARSRAADAPALRGPGADAMGHLSAYSRERIEVLLLLEPAIAGGRPALPLDALLFSLCQIVEHELPSWLIPALRSVHADLSDASAHNQHDHGAIDGLFGEQPRVTLGHVGALLRSVRRALSPSDEQRRARVVAALGGAFQNDYAARVAPAKALDSALEKLRNRRNDISHARPTPVTAAEYPTLCMLTIGADSVSAWQRVGAGSPPLHLAVLHHHLSHLRPAPDAQLGITLGDSP